MRQWNREALFKSLRPKGNAVAGVFENATRWAIEEIVRKHAQKSKFGMILTEESFEELRDELYDLLLTSRSLKAQGDKFMQAAASGSAAPKTPPRKSLLGDS